MKKILGALIGLALCAQAQIVYLYHADLQSPWHPDFYGEVMIYESLGKYVFDINWNDPGYRPAVDTVLVNSSVGYYGTTLFGTPNTFSFPMSIWQDPFGGLVGQDMNLNPGGDIAIGAVGTIYPIGVIPEPVTFSLIAGLGLLGFACYRRRVLPLAALSLLLCVPSNAADDDPLPLDAPVVETATTRTLQDSWVITITSTPIEKVGGVNVGNVTKVMLAKITRTETRTIVDGVQVGDVRVQTRSVDRDITAYVITRELSDQGILRLDFNTNKFTKPEQLWRRTDE